MYFYIEKATRRSISADRESGGAKRNSKLDLAAKLSLSDSPAPDDDCKHRSFLNWALHTSAPAPPAPARDRDADAGTCITSDPPGGLA